MKARARKNGFTLIEVLMAMMIMALIMTSVGAAFRASLASYDANDKFTTATQVARVAIMRITREVRTAADIDSTATTLTITPPNEGAGLTKIVYEADSNALYCRRTVDGTETTYVLVGGEDGTSLETFSVLREDDLEGNPISITIRMEVAAGGESFSATSSATIRKRQLY